MLEDEFKFYQNNRADLLKKFNNRYVVIKDQKVLGDFTSREEAIEVAQMDHPLGTFLVHLVSSEEEPVLRFYSRVSFDDRDLPSPPSIHH